MFEINICQQDSRIQLEFSEFPTLDLIKREILKKIQLNEDEYQLSIFEEVLLRDNQLEAYLTSEEQSYELNLIKLQKSLEHVDHDHDHQPHLKHNFTQAFFTQAFEFVSDDANPENHEFNSKVLIYLADIQENAEKSPQLHQHALVDENRVLPEMDESDEDEYLDPVNHESEEEEPQQAIINHVVFKEPQVPERHEKVEETNTQPVSNQLASQEESSQSEPRQNPLLAFFIKLYQTIIDFVMRVLSAFRNESTESHSMSMR